MKRLILHFFSFLAITSFLFLAFGSDDNGSEPSSSDSKKFLAYNYARDFVKKSLKSPSTAEFPGTFEKGDHVTKLGDSEYLIISWVDSQNSFGATIRSKFSCRIIFDGDNVRCEDLLIE